jgi:diphthine synthase
MLVLIGLGLGDEKDITVNGLEALRKCSRVFLEMYTSVLGVSKERMEEFYGKEIHIADREFIESESDKSIIAVAATEDVAVLVVGDPFGATTHSDLIMRAHKAKVPFRVFHNASILNAVGVCGLQLYKFGQTVSIVFWTETWRPDSFYDKIKSNRKDGLHTLCLLDIKVREISDANLARGRRIYEPPRYMTVNTALQQLLECEQKRQEGAFGLDTLCVGLARVGHPDQVVKSGTMSALLQEDFGPPLHSLVIAGATHFLELDHVQMYAVSKTTYKVA